MRARLPGWMSWRRVAVAGLAALAAIMALGASLPDPAELTDEELAELRTEQPLTLAVAERFPAGRLLASPWLLLLPGALAAAICANVVRRVRQWKARKACAASPLDLRAQLAWTAAAAEAEAQRLASRLRRAHYVLEREQRGPTLALVARRGALGFWGSIAFHLSLVLLLAGIAVTLLFSWRGEVVLAEGQDVALDDPAAVHLLRRSRFAPRVPHVVLQLGRFDAVFQGESPVDYRAGLAALDPRGRMQRADVRVNQPLTVGGQRLYLQRHGLAPLFEVRREGKLLLRAPVSLVLLGNREDSFEVPGTGLRVFVRASAGAFDLTLFEGRRQLGARQRLQRGGEVSFGAVRIRLPEVRRWVLLGVDRDPGELVIALASLLGIAGLALRLWDHEREIRIRVEPTPAGAQVEAAGRSRWFPTFMSGELRSLRDAA